MEYGESLVWNQFLKMILNINANLPKENRVTGPYFFDSCRTTLCSKGLVYTAIRMKMAYISLQNTLWVRMDIEFTWFSY